MTNNIKRKKVQKKKRFDNYDDEQQNLKRQNEFIHRKEIINIRKKNEKYKYIDDNQTSMLKKLLNKREITNKTIVVISKENMYS